ncbi:MAG: hypothetical protein ACK56I_07610 [bacterium]
MSGQKTFPEIQVPWPPLHLDGVRPHDRAGEDLLQLDVRLQDVGAADNALEVVDYPPVVPHHREEFSRVVIVVGRLVHVEAW